MNVDPDQTQQKAASDLGLRCLFRPVCLSSELNQHLTKIVLNFEKKIFSTRFCGRVADSVDPDQTPQYAASDLSLHCLFRSV